MKKIQLLRFDDHLKNLKWMVIIFALFSLNNTFAQVSNTGTSSDGRFTLTKAAKVSSVPSGGGEVTYTYTIKNSSNIRQINVPQRY